jgi:hypothetical protein
MPGPFLGNGSVNTFPLLGSRFLIIQQLNYNNGTAVFFAGSMPTGCKRDDGWSLDENIKGLNLAVVKLTTVQVTRLPL